MVHQTLEKAIYKYTYHYSNNNIEYRKTIYDNYAILCHDIIILLFLIYLYKTINPLNIFSPRI